jgi:1-deoxy-D-xylulose-5-phosphate reductoisomerase
MKISHKKLDLAKLKKLEFFEVDENKFLSLKICREALEVEGNAPAILNASNEIAVERFLNSQITFDKIPQIVLETLNKIPYKKLDSIDDVLLIDKIARDFARNLNL